MDRTSLRSWVVGAAMAAVAIFAVVLQPKAISKENFEPPNLEKMIPSNFGDWKVDLSIVPLTVSPDVAKTISTIYDETLSRTYVNSKGERIMLSLAYGANQSRALQLHKPEVCYSAQGFAVSGVVKAGLVIDGRNVPVMQLVGKQGGRVEPITYWMRIGDDLARGWYEQNKVRLLYGLEGKIPDGILVRVSNISRDMPDSYRLHAKFVEELYASMPAQARTMLVGTNLRQPG